MTTEKLECRGCGERLQPTDEVRAVYRERADETEAEPGRETRWGYTHIGHEPAGSGYRIIGRGRLSELEQQRLLEPQPGD